MCGMSQRNSREDLSADLQIRTKELSMGLHGSLDSEAQRQRRDGICIEEVN